MIRTIPAVFRGNYVIKPDEDESTTILNSYRFSQPTRAPRNLPQWRYESSCLDFRICHRHTDSCIFHLVLAILPPFILSFDFLSQIARNFTLPPCPSSSLPVDIFVCSLFRSLSRFLNFYSPSVLRFSSLSRVLWQYDRVIACVFVAGVIAYIRSELEDNKFSSVFRLGMNEQGTEPFRKITLGIAIARIARLRYCIILKTADIFESCFPRKHSRNVPV